MLEIKDIVKEYHTAGFTQKALNGVSLTLRNNEFVAILGPSGSGKTTLLNIIGGLDHYDSGDLLINGTSTKLYKSRDWDTYRNHSIGFVFQSYNLIGHQTVLENVMLALTIGGIKGEEKKKRATDALEKVGLKDHINKRPNQLSGGQMQRVAIARAIVNDPDIVLADEPTGALDTETGIQIMDILKNIAKDKLVVMVTHNPELAEDYATRIVKLKDGNIIEDSDPVLKSDEQELIKSDKKSKKKSKMGFGTSFKLSLNNLRTKKGRMILTSIAGSIGIIGIALIESLSNGVSTYMDDIQKETLVSYPLMIQSKTFDLSALETSSGGMSFVPDVDESKSTRSGIYSTVAGSNGINIIKNDLSSFKQYIDDPNSEIHKYIGENGVSYEYNAEFTVYSKDSDGEVVSASDNPENDSSMSGMSAVAYGMASAMLGSDSDSSTDVFSEISMNSDESDVSNTVKDSYSVVAGTWPQEYNDVLLVLDSTSSISLKNAYKLGFITKDQYDEYTDNADSETSDYKIFDNYSDVIGKEFYMVPASEYYKENENGTFSYEEKNAINEESYLDKAIKLKVSGVIKVNDKDNVTKLTTPVVYTSKLTDEIIKVENNSAVVKAQLADKDTNVLTGTKFNLTTDEEKIAETDKYLRNLPTDQKAQAYMMISQNMSTNMSGSEQDQTQQIITMQQQGMSTENMMALALDAWLDNNPDSATMLKIYKQYIGTSTYDDNLDKFGYIDESKPVSINIYTDSFEQKENLVNAIKEYNDGVDENEKITYTDYVALISGSLKSMINVISTVLLAFVSISLLVSCIMIGIITHISVLERTKEIGILRALGASKKNISQVFNAETIIIGLISGGIGVGVGYLLDIPATMIMQAVIGESNVAAILNPIVAIVLVGISVAITFIGGLIPASKAAKKDPVEALRSE